MTKPKPQELAQKNRNAFVQGKFMEMQNILFKSGLMVGEIGQILKGCNDNLNSMPVGQPEEPKEDKKNVKKKVG